MDSGGTAKKLSNSKKQQGDSRSANDSFIPPYVLDHASQRLFILSVFILIQCWKVYDIILIRTETLTTNPVTLTNLNNFTFVIKYAIIDGLFLWILPILNIPYLTFSPLLTLLLTLGMNAITFVLASNAAIPLFANLILPFWKYIFNKKELTIIGDSVSPTNVIDMNSHFKGKYTIQYLPDSSAHFNPFHFDKLCLDTNHPAPIMMPIEFNTTTDIGFLQIEHITPENEIHHVNYIKNDLNKLLKKDTSHLRKYSGFISTDKRVFYTEVPILAPGKYRISKVTDLKGTVIRSFKSDFLIAKCPNSEFVYPFPNKKSYKCVGDPDIEDNDLNLPLVKVSGVAPLNVEFDAKLTDGTLFKFHKTVETEKQTNTELDLIRTETLTRNLVEQELLWNPLILSTKNTGKVGIQIRAITDHLGNSKRYNPLSEDDDLWFEIDLRPVPPIRLVDTSASKALLVNSSKTLNLDYLAYDGDFPLTVNISYTSNENSLLDHTFKREFKNVQELRKGFEVSKEGRYQLVEAFNKFCPCKADPTAIDLVLAGPPQVDIMAEPILDKCVGLIGYKFDFDFEGSAPFLVQYQVFKNISGGTLKPILNEHGLTTRVIKSSLKHYNFEYKPRVEGEYVIIFKNIKDVNYNKPPIPLDEKKHTYLTYFKQRSSASFFENGGKSKTLSTCFNSSATVPLYFTGNLPFSFSYDVVNVQSKEKAVSNQKVTNWFDSIYNIELPSFKKGGTYSIVLKDAVDSMGCNAEFDTEESIYVRTRSDIPEISFDKGSRDFRIIEGDSVKIPLSLKSSIGMSSSDQLNYTITDLFDSSISKSRKLTNLNNFVVRDTGIYKLTSLMNGGCSGKISDEEEVRVSFYPRPNLTVSALPETVLKQHLEENFASVHLRRVCQYRENRVQLNLQGSAPFIVDYDIKFPGGNVETKSLSADSNNIDFDLPTSQSGDYEVVFKGVYDKLYTKSRILRLGESKGLSPVVRYDIFPLPNAIFPKSSNFVQICETALKTKKSSIPAIPVEFSGEYPFTIKASFKQGLNGKSQKFMIENIDEPYLHLSNALGSNKRSLDIEKDLHVGEHLITLHEVQDANGCIKKDLTSNNRYAIAVTEAPNISKQQPNKPYYCVGDHISYNMSGVSPFTVFYSFNGKSQKAELSHRFYRLASKPGVLTINGLRDSSVNKCSVNFTEGTSQYESLKLDVYDLPSVEVSQGENIIRNLHEGDQTEIKFTFTGTPPFYLKYIRTIENIDQNSKRKHLSKHRKQKNKVLETKVVEGIWDHEYTVYANLEGTYEAIEVRDAYCRAKRDDIEVPDN